MIITERTRDAMENANLSDRDTGVMQLNLTAQEEKNKSTPRKKMGKNFEKIKMKEKKHHPVRNARRLYGIPTDALAICRSSFGPCQSPTVLGVKNGESLAKS